MTVLFHRLAFLYTTVGKRPLRSNYSTKSSPRNGHQAAATFLSVSFLSAALVNNEGKNEDDECNFADGFKTFSCDDDSVKPSVDRPYPKNTGNTCDKLAKTDGEVLANPQINGAKKKEIDEKQSFQNDTAEDDSEDKEDWTLQYQKYCIEKEAELQTMKKKESVKNEYNKDTEDWAIQYHNYCLEKEEKLRKAEAKESEEEVALNKNDKIKKEGSVDVEDWSVQYQTYCIEKETKTEAKEKPIPKQKKCVRNEFRENVEVWAIQYQNYCIEKEATLQETAKNGPKESKKKDNIQTESFTEDIEDWAVQYQNYCIEKEAKHAKEEEKPKYLKGKLASHEIHGTKKKLPEDVEDWAIEYHKYCIENEANAKTADETEEKK
mmetsp:Transcript_6195/g.9512  ORF Transcript_6195/g.9512 Transcript_6195/m.9512 type:complete len:378 (-) Transcript_6195:283-1416(-)